ncbi:MAG TPA: bile acid:sodium symporter family protein [Prolixibacteraceae bacterium]|nr:bile acid:sodium symporter family protein [Prolixibacteraceae bacterium]
MSDIHYLDILVNAVLAIIMLGLGLTLTRKDFEKILIYPKAIIVGLSTQILVIPFIAFIIALISGISPEQKVGLVLVSTCASGASSNLITHLVRGNVALAISMTTLNSFITLVTLPFIVSMAMLIFLGSESEISLPIFETVLQIFLVTIVPASIGVYIRHIFTDFAIMLEKPLKFILPVFLGLVFSFKIFGTESQGGSGITFAEGIHIFPFVLLLNFGAMTAGYYVAKMMKLNFQNQFTVAIEVGLHNTALALLVAGTIIKSSEMEKPALIYALITFFTAFLFIYFVKGKNIFK